MALGASRHGQQEPLARLSDRALEYRGSTTTAASFYTSKMELWTSYLQ